VLDLHNELAGSGIHAAHIAINTWLREGGPEGIPSAGPEQVAPLYWACTSAATKPKPSSTADTPTNSHFSNTARTPA
jgi:hypothetical protein